MTFVVDASLAFKLLIVEADSADAWRFVEYFGEDLHAPDLLHVELVGVLVRLANQREIARELALERMDWWTDTWISGGVRSHRVDASLVNQAGRMAVEFGHPIKDCIYLALADRLGCQFVTADAKFRDRVADPARVKLLAELV